jgi:hypothetical protein
LVSINRFQRNMYELHPSDQRAIQLRLRSLLS